MFRFSIREMMLVTLVGVSCWQSFLTVPIHAEEAPKPSVYGIVGELTEDDRKQIESIAPDKLGKRRGEKIFEVKVTKPGVAVVSFGEARDRVIGSLRIYHLEKHEGKWRLVRIQYVIV
jgi:hypothetical protein